MSEHFDDAVVGAGILGLAHAYHLARRGRRVVVFERGARATGASLRNFGMLWPIGQPAGPNRRLAMRSREVWLDVLGASGLWHGRTGSLHLAYRDDEAQVLSEFVGRACGSGFECELLAPGDVLRRSPVVRPEGLRAGLFSPWETCVDPREVLAGLPGWLARARGVRFEFGRTVIGYDRPRVRTADARAWSAGRLWVCAGDDFRTLYPEAFGSSGFVRCKLQMMRAEPPEGGLRIGPVLAAGLTLRHYRSFEVCPTLPAVRDRFARESPEFDRFGIHVMASQNGRGEVLVGDSHEYGDAIEPFDKAEIDALILQYLATFLTAPLRIAARWHGTYATRPGEPYVVAEPAPGVLAVTSAGGAGMTLSFGLAEHVVNGVLGGGLTGVPIELVVFDIAGTTVEDRGSVNGCFRATLAAHGLTVGPEAVDALMGLPKPEAFRLLVGRSSLSHALTGRLGAIHAEFVARMKEFYAGDPGVREVPGVSLLFARLKAAGVKVALDTGFSRDITDVIVDRLGWNRGGLVDAIVASDEVAHGRPRPDMIRHLMDRLGVADPGRVVKVGDAPADLAEGFAAGCRWVVGVTWGTHTRDQLDGYAPTHLVGSVDELWQLLITGVAPGAVR